MSSIKIIMILLYLVVYKVSFVVDVECPIKVADNKRIEIVNDALEIKNSIAD